MNKKYDIEKVKKIFEEGGCELLENKYTNCKTKMKYKCSCNRLSEIALDRFMRGGRCEKCKGDRISKKIKK